MIGDSKKIEMYIQIYYFYKNKHMASSDHCALHHWFQFQFSRQTFHLWWQNIASKVCHSLSEKYNFDPSEALESLALSSPPTRSDIIVPTPGTPSPPSKEEVKCN